MSTVIIEIKRRVTASADQYLKFQVNAADWDRYLEMCEGDWTETVYALKDANLLIPLDSAEEMDEVFEVHNEQFIISGEED